MRLPFLYDVKVEITRVHNLYDSNQELISRSSKREVVDMKIVAPESQDEVVKAIAISVCRHSDPKIIICNVVGKIDYIIDVKG